jgi:phage tail sheath protein FI
MAVQVSYPGVYIEEFTPGAPIEGVGTSTAAFIGTAESGPIDEPKLIQSWDAFEATFGKFISGPSTGYLGPAVYGFFQNGGTTCYVVRHGTGLHSSKPLDDRKTGINPPALKATALQEGKAGDSLTVKVEDSSILADMLGGGTQSVKAQRAETAIKGMKPDKMTLTVDDHTGFAPGDSVLLTDKNNKKAGAVIASIDKTIPTLTVSSELDAALDFSQGTVRTADIVVGRRTFRLAVPSTLTLSTALPRGTAIKISGYETDTAANKTEEFCTVESAGGDMVTVTAPLKHTFILSDPNKVPTVESLEFDLTVRDTSAGKEETFKRLSMDPSHPNYWRTVTISQMITLALPSSPNSADDLRPKAQLYNLQGGTADDPKGAWTAINNDPNKYLNLLKPINEISLVCIPGATDKLVQQAVRDHCEVMADRFAILDSKCKASVETITAQWGDVTSAKGYAALYFPWILARNFVRGQDEFWPPSGHIAGIYARTDADPGVHKAPANAAIRGALGLQYRLIDTEQGPLNLKGINVLRVFQGQGQPLVWGARTTATDRNWQYVNIRRLFIFLEESIEEGIRWAVFEPNNLQLWGKLKRTITEFLTRVWRDGALFGKTATDAFYVRIDEALNPPSTQALGRLYIEIGVRPAYPAEFIVVRIGIWQGGSEVTEQ